MRRAAASSTTAAPPPPERIVVSGVDTEPGLNGTYERSGTFARDRPQWMKPNTRCYLRYIRQRWELYVSHHPAGTTYFFNNTSAAGDGDAPPPDGWVATECVMPHEVLRLVALPPRPEPPPTVAVAPPHLAPPISPDEDGEDPPEELVLFANATCPYAQRVRIALWEKGRRFTEVDVDIVGAEEEDPAALARAEAFRELWHSAVPNAGHRRPAIPLLQHGDAVTLPESAVIVDYLEDLPATAASDGRPLLPPAAADRARVRLFSAVFERELGGSLHHILGATTADALFAAGQELREGLGAVEAQLSMGGGRGGPFVSGEMFTHAEALCAPFLQRLYTLVPLFRPHLARMMSAGDAESFGDAVARVAPAVHRWAEAVLARPSVAGTYDGAAVAALKRRAVARYEQDSA
jgi:glutathione S-transferase